MFNIWKEAVLHEQSASEFNYLDILESFSLFFVCSTLTGIIIGVASALYFKYNNFVGNEGNEMVSFLIAAYMSFLFAECFALSGILSTLVCGVVMAAYTEPNLSDHNEGAGKSSSGIKAIIQMLAAFADQIVFIMTGLASVVFYDYFFFFFSFLVLLMCLLARAIAVFPLAYVSKFFRSEAIPLNHATMLWWAGLRGAIALALSVDIPSRHRHTLTACTCFIVFFTVAIQGGASSAVLKKLGIEVGVSEHEYNVRMSKKFEEEANAVAKGSRDCWQLINSAFLRPLLLRSSKQTSGHARKHNAQSEKDREELLLQVDYLQHQVEELREGNALVLRRMTPHGCCFSLLKFACCMFSETVSVYVFKLMNLLMMLTSTALVIAAVMVLQSEWAQMVVSLQVYASICIAFGSIISVISCCGCAASLMKGSVKRGLMLTCYCLLVCATFVATSVTCIVVLRYSHNLDLARQVKFNPSEYSLEVKEAQDRLHEDTARIYTAFQCHLGNSTVAEDRFEYIYKSRFGDVRSVQLNVTCAAGDGRWFADFVTDQCSYGGNVGEYRAYSSDCTHEYLSYTANQADSRSAAEGTEAYCLCRTSLSRQLSGSMNSIAGLLIALAVLQLVLLVGCVRLLCKGPPAKKKKKDEDKPGSSASMRAFAGAITTTTTTTTTTGSPNPSPRTKAPRRSNAIEIAKIGASSSKFKTVV
jgi:hypothetical protein